MKTASHLTCLSLNVYKIDWTFLETIHASAPNLETLNLSCIVLNDILDNDIVISRDYSGLIYAGNGSNAIKTSAEHLRHLEFTFGIKE